MNRNQYFLLGLVLLFLGFEFRMIESAVLTPEFTQFLAKRTGHPLAAVSNATQAVPEAIKPVIKKSVRPPDWLGWALVSGGAVLVLHAWGLPKQ